MITKENGSNCSEHTEQEYSHIEDSVCPKCKGTYLQTIQCQECKGTGHGLPHACGGVSIVLCPAVLGLLSSPCMWGCFYRKEMERLQILVFPMHVGVFLQPLIR